MHGSIEGIDASTLGVSNFIDFGTLGARSYVVFFGSFGFLGKKKASTFANGAFASTFTTQGPNSKEPINKKKIKSK